VIGSFRVDLEEPVELTADEARSVELFDMARREFKLGRYERAMELTEQAIPLNSDDVILHEFFALTLFALRKYDESAIVLNSLLAVAPGMDAETVGSLYASPEIYARQIRTLEDHVRGDAEDVSARFVLAYHKLVAGESKEASELLGEVTRMEPDDHVARQLLVDLKRDETVSESTKSELKEPLVLGVPDAVDLAEEPVEEQSTDLAGQWLASQSESKIELVLSEEGSFTWSTSQADQPTRVIRGEFVLAGDVLVLEGAEAGTFVGKVEPLGSDQFRFQFVNAPAEDSGLLFNRQK
jgi:tetratricopeptide (TPR) repeat protein